MRNPIVEQIFGANKAPLPIVLETDFADLSAKVEAAEERASKLPRQIKTAEDQEQIMVCMADLRDLSKRIDRIRLDEGEPLRSAQKGINDHFKGLDARLATATGPLQRAADDHARRKVAEERARREREAQEARAKAEAERAKAEAARSANAAAKAEGRAEAAAAQAEAAEKAATAKAGDMARTRAGGVTSSAKTVWQFRITDYHALTATMGALGNFIDQASVEKAIRSMVRIQKGATSLPGVEVFEDVVATARR